MAVQYIGRGSRTLSANAVTATLPTGVAEGDLMILAVGTANQAITTPDGWIEVANSPQGAGTGGQADAIRLGLYYKIATSSESDLTVADTGDYQIASIFLFRGTDTTTPFNTTAGRVQTSATTTYTGNAITTTIDGCMIVDFIGIDRDVINTANLSSWTNASLETITEILDYANNTQTGGGLGVANGIDTIAGSVDATTATLSASQIYASITVAISPPVVITGQKLKYWSGSAWVEGTLKRYDGATWVDTVLKYWNGSNWV